MRFSALRIPLSHVFVEAFLFDELGTCMASSPGYGTSGWSEPVGVAPRRVDVGKTAAQRPQTRRRRV